MNQKKPFLVLRSVMYSLARIILIIVPFVVFLLLDDEAHHLESVIFSAILFAVMVFAVISISPIILISDDGMKCVLWLKKSRFMAWSDVQVVGRIHQSVGTVNDANLMDFIYFASAPVRQKISGRSFYAPQLTNDFFFLTDSKRLQLELKKHLKEADYRRIYRVQEQNAFPA